MYGGTVMPADVPDEAAFLTATEQIIRRHAQSGGAVILGRAGMVVLADHPHLVRVRLSGPVEARIAQAMRRYGLSENDARRQARENDGARAAWVQRFYGCDIANPALYDLVLDATRFPLEDIVALVVTAARAI